MKNLDPTSEAAEQHRRAETPGQKQITLHSPFTQTRSRRLSHEHSTHQIELELQSHALLSKCEQLEQRLKSYTELYDFAPIGYFTLNDHGIIQQANLTGAKLLGQERAHLCGQPFSHFVSAAVHPTFEAFLGEVLAGISKGICEIVLVSEDTPHRHVHLEGLGLASDSNRWCHIAVMDITAQKAAEKALRDSETFNTTVLDSLTEQVVVIDTDGIITKVNAAWRRSAEESGAPKLAEHSVGWSYRKVCLSAIDKPGGAEAAAAWAGIEAVLTGEQDHFMQEYPCNSPEALLWFRMRVYPLVAPQRGAVITHQNITEQKQYEEWLKLSEARYSTIVEAQNDLISRFLPDGTLTFVNDAYCRYFGRSREEFLATNLMGVVPEEDQSLVAKVLIECNAKNPFYMVENQVVRADGEVRWVQWSNQAILDENQALLELQSVGRDVTERKRMEAILQEIVITDDLTGLANRRHFMKRLDEEYARLQRHDTPHAAVLMLDLDYFKQINDARGHAVGDAALRHFAMLLQTELRKIDIAGRVGGEEFAILLPGADPVDAKIFAERLRQKVAMSPCVQENQSVPVTVSIGIAALSVTDSRPDVALIRADQALYQAKEQGRNQVVIAD